MDRAGHLILATSYLANKPAGAILVYLIVALTLLGVATIFAGWTRSPWQGAVSAALFFLVLAFIV